MDIEEAKKELQEIKKDNESKAMIIHNNSSNMQIRWSNKDLKEMAEISQRCARENRAIEIVLNELEKKDKEIARLGKTANEYKKAIQCEKCNCSVCEAHINTLELRAELEKKDKIIDLIVEDFQNEGYLKGMSREEILDYYQKRLWLNKQRNPLPLKLDITG